MRGSPASDPAAELELAGGRVELWLAELERPPWPSPAQARGMLSAEELERCAQVIDSERRSRMLRTRASVRVILGARLGCEPRLVPLGRDREGRPLLAGQELSLSISHSGEWVALALAQEVSVGVDIEWRGRAVSPGVIARFLSGRELAELHELSGKDRSEAFLRLWTLKEACAKSLGGGLGANLERLELLGGLGEPRLSDPAFRDLELRSWDPLPELIGAVAARPEPHRSQPLMA